VAILSHILLQFRDDTVYENDNLSASRAPGGLIIFGEGERWDNPGSAFRRMLLTVISAVLAICVSVFFIARKLVLKKHSEKILEESAVQENLLQSLSPRENEIFKFLLSGMTIKEIAFNLDISYSGVNYHVQNIYSKLGVQSRTEFIVKFGKKREQP
jgi:DNA-binding CsgD family transcriptional regulator